MNGVLMKLQSAQFTYNLIDIKGYAIVSVRKVPMLGGGK